MWNIIILQPWRYKVKFSCKRGRKNCEIRVSLSNEYKNPTSLDVTPCNLIDRFNCFGGTGYLHFRTEDGRSRFL
jgi:hypothetical protein